MTHDRNTAAVESDNVSKSTKGRVGWELAPLVGVSAISAARVFQMPVELIAEASLEKLPIAFSMEVY